MDAGRTLKGRIEADRADGRRPVVVKDLPIRAMLKSGRHQIWTIARGPFEDGGGHRLVLNRLGRALEHPDLVHEIDLIADVGRLEAAPAVFLGVGVEGAAQQRGWPAPRSRDRDSDRP